MRKTWWMKMTGLALCCTLAGGLLAGCGGKAPESSQDSSGAGESAADQAQGGSSEEPYEVTMLTQGEQQEDLPRILEKVNEILLRDLNMTLNLIVAPYGSMSQQRQLMLTSGEPLDLVYLDASAATGFINNKQIIDLSDLIDEYGTNIKKYWGDEAKSANIGGFVYGVPNLNEVGNIPAIGMRKDMVEKYDIDVDGIKSLEDLEPVLAMIKEKEPAITPVYVCSDQPPVSRQLSVVDPLTDGIAVLDNSGLDNTTVIPVTQSKAYKEKCELFHRWYEAGYINPDAATTTVQFESAFKAGSAFSAIMVWHPMSPDKFGGVDVVYAYLGDHIVLSGATGNADYAIAAQSKDPAKAMQMLDYLYGSQEVAQLLNWGEEGIDWVYTDDTKQLVTWPEGVDSNNATYHAQLSWALPNQFMSTSWEGVYDADVFDQMLTFNKEGVKSKAFGFSYNTEPVSSELAALKNVQEKYRNSLETGSVDPEEYLPMYEEDLKKAGLDKLIAEKQKQLDEWLAGQGGAQQ